MMFSWFMAARSPPADAESQFTHRRPMYGVVAYYRIGVHFTLKGDTISFALDIGGTQTNRGMRPHDLRAGNSYIDIGVLGQVPSSSRGLSLLKSGRTNRH